MKKIGKLLSLVLALAMVLALASCGGGGGGSAAPAGSGSAAPAASSEAGGGQSGASGASGARADRTQCISDLHRRPDPVAKGCEERSGDGIAKRIKRERIGKIRLWNILETIII